MNKFKSANELMAKGHYDDAIIKFLEIKNNFPELKSNADFNINFIKKFKLNQKAPLPSNISSAVAVIADPEAIVANRNICSEIDYLRSQNNSVYYSVLKKILSNKVPEEFLVAVKNNIFNEINRLGVCSDFADYKVSIVMPVRNRAGLVADAINSILRQSYLNWELLICDDASDDETLKVIKNIQDPRVKIFANSERKGAAASRNTCIKNSTGKYIAYLDSDNIWNPRYLEYIVEQLVARPGYVSAYAGFFDVLIDGGKYSVKNVVRKEFFLEDQIEKPFIDLNSFVHRRELFDLYGGFDESLPRRQDYDLISRYCWIREPLFIPAALNLYQRFKDIETITSANKGNHKALEYIDEKIRSYYSEGVPLNIPSWVKKVTVISWDSSRNHFAKAFCVAEALSEKFEVQLLSFRFFEHDIFQPLKDENAKFEVKIFEGKDFPDFGDNFAKAVSAITGDVIYCVKPRLTSLGVALLRNYHYGTPIILECNDLETVVNTPKSGDKHVVSSFDALPSRNAEALVPHSLIWSEVLDTCVKKLPVVFTHNINLNRHYDYRCLYMRNIKNEKYYNPSVYNKSKIRAQIGLNDEDRIILFGGLVRKHKGIFELIELLDKLQDERYKVVIVGSRETPDLKKITSTSKNRVIVLPPQSPQKMAELNFASDVVVLWFDPKTKAGYYQSPYKMSDALAMGVSIIASPTSDQAKFSYHKLMHCVPFGDYGLLVKKINEIFNDVRNTEIMRLKTRKFFLREFSYKSVNNAFSLGLSLLNSKNETYEISTKFQHHFSKFYKLNLNENSN